MNLDTYMVPLIKIHLKWIKDLNISLETIKLLEDNIRTKLHGADLGNNFFFNTTSKVLET